MQGSMQTLPPNNLPACRAPCNAGPDQARARHSPSRPLRNATPMHETLAMSIPTPSSPASTPGRVLSNVATFRAEYARTNIPVRLKVAHETAGLRYLLSCIGCLVFCQPASAPRYAPSRAFGVLRQFLCFVFQLHGSGRSSWNRHDFSALCLTF